MYSLIEFPMNDGQKAEVEVVPDIWLEQKDNKWYCFWPCATSMKQIRKAIEKKYLPEKDWTKYNCRPLYKCESYDEARKKLVDAEFTSTLESDAELHKRPKRKIKRPYRPFSSSESDNAENVICNKIPSLPKLRALTKSNTILSQASMNTPYKSPSKSYTSIVASPKRLCINYEKSSSSEMNSPKRSSYVTSDKSTSRKINSPKRLSSDAMNSEKINSPRHSPITSERHFSKNVHPPQRSSNTASSSGFDKSDLPYLILTKLTSLENSMNLLLPMTKQLMAHFRLTKIPHAEDVPQIPVDSDDNLNKLEIFLDDKKNFEYMINTLSLSGGTTISQITRRTLEKLITNNYGTNFNWAGRAPKKAFKSLKMKDLVIATVKSVEPNAAINLIENSIKDWLKLSSVRMTLAESRKLKRNVSITD